jgi:single-strand DNA-binding protein
MAFANKVILLGNLTRDPESRGLPSGGTVVSTGIAVNRKWSGGEEVLFMDLSVFGKLADIVAQYARKGMQVYLEGRLKLDQWNDREGNKRSKISAVVDTFQMLGSPPAKPGEHEYYQPPQQSPPAASSSGFQVPDDDIPF